MLIILWDIQPEYTVLDLCDKNFKHTTSSLFYYFNNKEEDCEQTIRIDIFYFRQLRILFWLALEKFLGIKHAHHK